MSTQHYQLVLLHNMQYTKAVKKKTVQIVNLAEFTPEIKQRLLTQLSAIYRDTLIVFSYQQEATITKIAEEMGLDKSTVSRIVKKWKKETQR